MKGWMVFAVSLLSFAQVEFEISPRKIGINQAVQFTVRIENSDRNDGPSFPRGIAEGDFALISSRASTSFQSTIINGRMSTVRSFTYSFRPTKKGRLTFPAQSVTVDGREYSSRVQRIEVGDEVRNLSQPSDPFSMDDLLNRGRSRRRQGSAEVFAEVVLPKRSYYLGEPIPLLVKLWRTPGVQIRGQGSSMDFPNLPDFWVEETEGRRDDSIEIRDRKRYEVSIVDSRRLYANKTGKVEVPPIKFTLIVSPRMSFFSDWQQIVRQTDSVVLHIKPLPRQGKPEDFSGAVGSFELKGELDKPGIKVGESVSLKVTVEGNGNFSAIRDLAPKNLGPQFEIFAGGAPVTDSRDGIVRSKSWVFALVPKQEGRFEIPLPRLSFFDLDSETYRTTPERVFTLEVLPGRGLAPAALARASEGALISERHLNFIKLGDMGQLKVEPFRAPPSLLVQVAAGFLVLDLLAFLALFFRNRSLSRRQDLRPRYAMANFKKAVSRLRSRSDDTDTFYAGLSQAVFNYFGDKWERPGQGISLDLIRDRFHHASVDENLYQRVTEVIEACDLARFTPSTPAARDQLLQKAAQTQQRVEEALP